MKRDRLAMGRDKLFYEDAVEAVKELYDKKEPLIKRPIIPILGLLVILILAISFIPIYSVRLNPPPDTIKIDFFQLNENEISFLESLSKEHYSSINTAISNINTGDYKPVSARLSISSCRTSSNLCYSKALYYYIQDKITYIHDPSSREYVQLPQQTLLQKSGDCEDKSLVLAAMLESIGIDADVGITSNHAFVRAKVTEAPFWIKRNSDYVFLDPSSDRDFGEVSFREEEIVRFFEIY